MSKPIPSLPIDQVPEHVAIIMDGNGRWALKRSLPRLAGHHAGTENLGRIIRASVEFGIKYLTIYAFSTENWGRPREEVDGLMRILEDVIEKELNELNEQGVQIRHLGRLDQLSPRLQKKVIQAVESTKHNSRLVLNVAFNYGGCAAILESYLLKITHRVPADRTPPGQLYQHLCTTCVSTHHPSIVISFTPADS